MQEIERKFLVVSEDFKKEAFKNFSIKQGFLNTHPERTVRLRITGDKAFITIKGKSSKNGLSRFEWEKEIDVKEAEALFELCEPGIIEKTRYLVKAEDFVFEIDEFYGENEGLKVAEIELNKETDTFEKPQWLGTEVTGEIKYYNSQLSKNPFKDW
ncbi:CYTH domain-containing protein [Salegentibacter salarius]|uniref:Adenylate cyclase n=1 Tax=Salegentibacter salarius TaxID=435906 RepID=A0A2N0TUN7_9FLAO|nr:CYTH domain-containing protein [Salegentibacter salarius]OEY72136.1 adenylate cyclase [Salegentibacter salarius]PKD18457.1 adenylate cyclase [Salegentibacter salarius]SLJ87676.1 CYTH domain-containing protein [Salegentibacter salarius]